MSSFDVIVIGTGAAGLATALKLAPLKVLLLTKTAKLPSGSTLWAQGGIAAAVGAEDAPARHIANTLTAGTDNTSPEAAQVVCEAGPDIIQWLDGLGMPFDRRLSGAYALGKEAAHDTRRILHAHGDATGRALTETLHKSVISAEHITLHTRAFAWDICVNNDQAHGLHMATESGWQTAYASHIVLATGGIGQIFPTTTNPCESTADGIGLAARAGAQLADMEMVQFHPTALAVEGTNGKLPLLSEALRGEGAKVVNKTGTPIMPSLHPDADLAPRDVVARAVWQKRAEGEDIFLDCRNISNFAARFPAIHKIATDYCLNPTTDFLPVTPAAHYHMGGVLTDLEGRTSIKNLYAVGETACTGLHGANRLASNSLLECLAFANRVSITIKSSQHLEIKKKKETPTFSKEAGTPSQEAIHTLRKEAFKSLGLQRDGCALKKTLNTLKKISISPPQSTSFSGLRLWGEAQNMLLTTRLLAHGALMREESRGAHLRTDFPLQSEKFKKRQILTQHDLKDAPWQKTA